MLEEAAEQYEAEAGKASSDPGSADGHKQVRS